MATALLAALPVVLLYLMAQRQLVSASRHLGHTLKRNPADGSRLRFHLTDPPRRSDCTGHFPSGFPADGKCFDVSALGEPAQLLGFRRKAVVVRA